MAGVLPLFLLLMVAILSFVPIGVVRAANPSIVNVGTYYENSVSSYTLSVSTVAGRTYFLQSACSPHTVTITSVSSSLGATWGVATSGSTPYDSSFTGITAETWFAQVNTGQSGSDTLTVNLAVQSSACTVDVSYSTSQVGLAQKSGGPLWSQSGSSWPSSGNIAQVGSVSIQVPANALVLAMSLDQFGGSAYNGNTGYVTSGTSPTVSGFNSGGALNSVSVLSTNSIGSGSGGVICGFSQTYYGGGNGFAQFGWAFQQNAGYFLTQSNFVNCQGSSVGSLQADGNYDVFVTAATVFVAGGSNPLACTNQSCLITNGGSTVSTSTSTLTANTVYLYPATTPTSGEVVVQNITVKVSSLPGAGHVFLGVYEAYTNCPGTSAGACGGVTVGGVAVRGNTATVTASNPLHYVGGVSYSYAGAVGSSFYLHLLTPYTIINGTTWAVALSCDMACVVYQSTTGLMDADSSDGFAPLLVTTYSSSTPPLYFAAYGSLVPFSSGSSSSSGGGYTCGSGTQVSGTQCVAIAGGGSTPNLFGAGSVYAAVVSLGLSLGFDATTWGLLVTMMMVVAAIIVIPAATQFKVVIPLLEIAMAFLAFTAAYLIGFLGSQTGAGLAYYAVVLIIFTAMGASKAAKIW